MTDQLKTQFVVLQFSRPDPASESIAQRIISAGICKETRSEICHVDIEMPDGTLIGAHMPDGIQCRKPDYEAWGLRIRVYVPVAPYQAENFYQYARAKVGTPYDPKSIAGIALGDSDLHDSHKLICSAFAALDADIHGVVRVAKDYWMVSPEELRIAATATYGAIEQRVEGNGPVPPLQFAEGAHA